MFLTMTIAASIATPPVTAPPTFVMSVDGSGRAVCSVPTDRQRIMILDHIERHRVESEPELDLDYLVDSSGLVNLKFRGAPSAARDSIRKAMDIWYEQLEITVPFTLTVYWEEFEKDEDGAAPLAFVRGTWDEEEEEGSWWCWEHIDWGCVPMTLANQRTGFRVNGQYDPDPEFEVHFNQESPWYMRTSGPPGRREYDLVTVMLHEIGHALGFSSAFDVDHDKKTGRNWWDEYKFSKYYDQFVWSRSEGDILDLRSPSRELYDALTGNRLFWGRSRMENWHGETLLSVRRNGGPVMLWGSNTTEWGATVKSGALVSHLDADAFPESGRDGLMTPYQSRGLANHRIGPVTLGMLYDLGWTLQGYRRPTPPPPPEPEFNPDAAEAWALLRMIGSEESDYDIPHIGVLLHATGGSHGLFGVESAVQHEPRIILLHAYPIDSRSLTIHMKADGSWVPHLVISEKNEPAEGFEESGLEYSTTVELTGTDFEVFTQTRDRIELHVHFSGDSRRTVLTFPLRMPIN